MACIRNKAQLVFEYFVIFIFLYNLVTACVIALDNVTFVVFMQKLLVSNQQIKSQTPSKLAQLNPMVM